MTAAALIDACVMECYFREHMAERDLLFHDLVAPHLAAYEPAARESQQRDFLTHLHATLNAPCHPIRNRRLRLTADSPDLLTTAQSTTLPSQLAELATINEFRSIGGKS